MIWAVLQSYGVGTKLRILKIIYTSAKTAIHNGSEIGKWFKPEKGTYQGDPILPVIFITFLERVLEQMQDTMQGIQLSRQIVNNLWFANDICLIKTSWEKLQKSVGMVKKDTESTGPKINVGKMKTLVITIVTHQDK